MDALTKISLIVVPLLIWAGVFAFIWSVDRRVRALERRLQEHRDNAVSTAGIQEAKGAVQEVISR